MALNLEEQEQVDELKRFGKNMATISPKVSVHFLFYMASIKVGVITKRSNH